MHAPVISPDCSVDPSVNDVAAIATPAWPMRRLREVTVLICCSVAACSNSADPGSIEQFVRALLN